MIGDISTIITLSIAIALAGGSIFLAWWAIGDDRDDD